MAENYNVGNVEIQVKTAAEKAISSLDVLINRVNTLNSSVTKTVSKIAAINNTAKIKNIKIDTSKSDTIINKTTNSLKKLNNEIKKASTSSAFFSIGKMTMLIGYARRLANVFSDIVAKGIDFIETANLFQVSMGDMYYQALKFNNEISRTFGMNQEQLMRYQATFKNMLSALGSLSSEISYNLSEVLTKSALDYASLFNTTVEQAMTAYKAVLAGQIRPIRSVSGFDVAEQTIFVKAQELGINKTVRQLSQLEKRLLRIIVLNEQMFNLDVIGDFAQTIEQPAQQLRVFVAQLQETGRWISITFMETISNVLPYVNGFIMTIKEVVKSLAYFGSWRLEKVRAGVDPLTELTEGADNAGEAVDNLQKKLFSFDKFEVLGGSEQSSLFGLDQRIIDALKDYDNLMGDIKMRANEISESLMRWLGYIPVEELDDAGEKTGGIVWQLKEGETTLSKIVPYVKAIGGFLAVGIATKLVGVLASVLGINTALKAISKLFTWQGALLAVLGYAYATNEKFRESINKLLPALVKLLDAVLKPVIDILNVLTPTLTVIINTITPIITLIVDITVALIDFLDNLGLLQPLLIGIIGYIALLKLASLKTLIAELALAMAFSVIPAIKDFAIWIGNVAKALWTTLVGGIKAAIAWLGSLSAATWVTIGAIGILLAQVLNLALNWDKMSGIERVVGILGAVAAAATIAAIAVGNLQSAWTLGIGAVAIVAGIASMVMAINRANNDAQSQASKMKNVTAYASGGFVDKGELFIARENGPEMVGTMSSKTVVANNNQIVEGISSGVYNAVSSAMSSGGGANITVDFKNADDSALARLMVKPLRKAFNQQGIKVGG